MLIYFYMQIITFTQIIITTLYLPPKVSSNPKSQIGKNHLGLLFLKVPNPKPPEFHVLGDTTSTNLVIFTCHFQICTMQYHSVCEIQGVWDLGLGLCLLNLGGKLDTDTNPDLTAFLAISMCLTDSSNRIYLIIQYIYNSCRKV